MLVEFEKLPESSRVWIYQASRSFSEAELIELRSELDSFLQEWTAHGNDLNAGYEIPYNRFIVIALDQSVAGATGCSIDSSVRFIQALEAKYNIDLLDKMNVSYKQGEFVAYKTLIDFRKMAKNKSVSKNTIVFNNLVINKGEYQNNWEVPASESWHASFM
ncbi:ABC transporter ATPase [Cellulophaga sp. HaHaR_3_176]|uniref:ABC transporter ATPase n=1 Tax=Cellulophaga sp. HaHaR_3_176 TaxID=1942464 RepID=UPI001C1F93A3|nr:ABC transporter ATPase [Cellulophaga sp. HaHaR_3_176]QWX84785.1 ABC transporter ATPase [Cellulophaga sp. HaHaR_3_176]